MTSVLTYVSGAFVVVLALAAITAWVAKGKGHSAPLWFLLGVLLPGISLLVAAVMAPQHSPHRVA